MFYGSYIGFGGGGGGAADAFSIGNSCRFDGSARVTNANGTPTSATTATIAFWFKLGVLTAEQAFFGAEGFYTGLAINVGKTLQIVHGDSGAVVLTTTQVFRDPTAWYHCMVVFDTTEGTDTNRVKLYINGAQVTAFTAGTWPSEDAAFVRWNTSGYTNLVGDGHSTKANFDGYLAEFHSVDGAALAPTVFGEFDDNGVWRPIEVSGVTYGNNGFYLDFAVAPATGNGAGTDVSGNSNHCTDSGLVAADQVTDTPTKNYCTWNPIIPTDAVLSDGNLTVALTGNVVYDSAGATISFPPSGKFYFEVTATTLGSTNGIYIGIADAATIKKDTSGIDSDVKIRAYQGTAGTIRSDLVASASYGDAWGQGETVGVAVDMDNGALYFRNEGVWQDSGDPTSGASKTGAAFTDLVSSGHTWTPFVHNDGTSESVYALNCGQFDYEDTAPEGFKNLNTANFPAPQRTGHVDSQFVGAYDTGENIVATLDAAKDGTWTSYINMYRILNNAGTGANWQFSDDTSNQLTLPGPSPGAKSSFVNPSVTASANTWNGYSWRVGAAYGV